jgi:hypothetical protein
MPDISEFHHYTELLDKMIQIADKEDLAECARLLAMYVAHYEMRYRALSLEEQLGVTSKLNEHHAELLARGMETMVGVLGSVIQGLDEKVEH